MTPDSLVLMAKIGRAHGLRGECYLHSYTDPPEAIFSFAKLQTAAGEEMTVAGWRAVTNGFLVTWHGLTDRNAASRLTNQNIFIKRQFLPATAAHHHYQHDLSGFTVVANPPAGTDANDTIIGQVAGFANYGAGDILVIKNNQEEEYFLPFQKFSIIKILTAEKKIIIAPEFLL